MMSRWDIENDDGWFIVYKDGVEVASSENGDRMADVLNDAFHDVNARIAELEAAQRWIPVSERLPEFNKVVAVIDMSDKDSHLCNVYETAILVKVRGDTRFGFIGHSGWDSSYVTHWMPLPEVPEVKE